MEKWKYYGSIKDKNNKDYGRIYKYEKNYYLELKEIPIYGDAPYERVVKKITFENTNEILNCVTKLYSLTGAEIYEK